MLNFIYVNSLLDLNKSVFKSTYNKYFRFLRLFLKAIEGVKEVMASQWHNEHRQEEKSFDTNILKQLVWAGAASTSGKKTQT